MTHKELINSIASKISRSEEETEKLLEATVLFISEKLSDAKSVGLQSFGSFEVKRKEERLAIHPATKERLLVPPKQIVAFKQSVVLKDKLKDLSHE